MNYKRSDISPMPEYFDRYINLVADTTLHEAFQESLRRIDDFDAEKIDRIDRAVYALEKWTSKTILQHVTDFERILSYRTLLFARGDKNPRASIDQELLADTARADTRRAAALLAELRAVRLATVALFQNFDEKMLAQSGLNWKYETSVAALGFAIVGHQIHHFNIIEKHYFPLAVLNRD